jgi:3-methylfumaryl-CoA hydratase
MKVSFDDGDLLPRGWHVAFFAPAVPQSALNKDGVPQADTLLPNPDPISFPRKVFGGRQISFNGDLHVGAKIRRESEILSAQMKPGRDGSMLIVRFRHAIYEEETNSPMIVEEQDAIFLPSASAVAPKHSESSVPLPRKAESSPDTETRAPILERAIVFDTTMLFRYSAVTFNAHRIHYDYPYASQVEGYPALLVNAGLSSLSLLELAREHLEKKPSRLAVRNRRPIQCGEPVFLYGNQDLDDRSWKLWVQTKSGVSAVEATLS